MKKYLSLKFIKGNIYLILVILVSGALRLLNLGYSDYQGDEIKALYLPEPGQSFFSYIMDQRKGPIQFIVTYLLKFINPNYDNQLLIRLPFALAGLFAVVYFYKFVKIHFGEKIAFYSSLFFSTNGLFIAFSRIVQYQSFVILFMVLSLYYLTLATTDNRFKIKGIYLGLIMWALSLLSHYDGIFIFPFVVYLVYIWVAKCDLSKKLKVRTLIFSGAIFLVLLLSFYIPFLLSISAETKDYWAGRISGEVSSKIASSKYLFTVYQPIYAIHIYIVLFILGCLFFVLGFFSRRILKIKDLPEFLKSFFTHTTGLMNLIQENKIKVAALFIWFVTGALFFEKIVYISGTHIYTYLIPTFIILGFGFVTLESAVFKIFELPLVRMFNFFGIVVLFSFLAVQSYFVFVDSYREYPWEDEDFLLWRFVKPNNNYHLSLFGFPYYRDWEGIQDFVLSHPEINAYTTNERTSISGHYINLPKNSDRAGFYILIKNPQSYTEEMSNDKTTYWTQKYDPQFTLTKYGRDMVRIYIMAKGSIFEIIDEGF